MKMLSRLKFAFKYDFEPEFIVIPFGENPSAVRFFNYDEAKDYAKKWQSENVQYLEPSVLVIVFKPKGKNK